MKRRGEEKQENMEQREESRGKKDAKVSDRHNTLPPPLQEEKSGAVSGQRPSGRIGWNWRCPLSSQNLCPRTKSSRLANIWQYLQFSPVAGIFANIEYWPLLNADELVPDIEYWLDIERGDIIVRHSINQFGNTRNFDVIPSEMMNEILNKTNVREDRDVEYQNCYQLFE